MPDLDIITVGFCSSYWGVYEVPSSSDPSKTYRVTLASPEGEVDCSCPDFENRGQFRDPPSCKHTDRVQREACLWNPQWFDGNKPVKLKPIEYHYATDAILVKKCPNCGADVCPVRVAV